MGFDFVLLLGSMVIGACTIVAVQNVLQATAYYRKRNKFQKKIALLLSRTDPTILKPDEKLLFKIEGAEVDSIQKIFAKFNYSLLLHIKNLLFFVELGNKMSIRRFVIYSLAFPAILGALFYFYFPQMIIFSLFGILIPYLYLLYLRDQKIKTFVSYFPAALESMASNLKAGADIIRSIRAVAHDEENFFAKDFKHLLAEIELGVPIHESFQNYAKKIGIPEVDLFALGITLSMQSGANLAVFFTKVSEMIRKRIELKGKVNIVTSESRFSMLVMCLAPVGIATLQTAMDPVRYVSFLQSYIGQLVIYGSIVLITIAIVWVGALMRIED